MLKLVSTIENQAASKTSEESLIQLKNIVRKELLQESERSQFGRKDSRKMKYKLRRTQNFQDIFPMDNELMNSIED